MGVRAFRAYEMAMHNNRLSLESERWECVFSHKLVRIEWESSYTHFH